MRGYAKRQSQWARDLYLYEDAPENFFHAAPEIFLQMVPDSRNIV